MKVIVKNHRTNLKKQPREIFEEMQKRELFWKHEACYQFLPLFNLRNPPKLRCLLSLETGALEVLIKDKDISYL